VLVLITRHTLSRIKTVLSQQYILKEEKELQPMVTTGLWITELCVIIVDEGWNNDPTCDEGSTGTGDG
jgi:hypothetical protein